MGLLRGALVMLIVVWTVGAPGLGIETRAGGAVVGWMYTVAYLAIIVALVLTWRGRRFAPALVAAVGGAAAIIAVLDLSGVLSGPPPAGVIVLDAVSIGLGLFLILRARSMRPTIA